jgi:hypothetical protein
MVFQNSIGDAQELPSYCNHGPLQPPADQLLPEQLSEVGSKPHCPVVSFSEGPPEVGRPLPGDPDDVHRPSRGPNSRGQASVGHRHHVFGGGEASYVPQFRYQQQGGVVAHSRDGPQ